MKIIIDIDKELKSAIYNCGLFLNPADKTSLINAINNGIPLNDIRAEIDGYCSDNRDRNDGLYIAMKIIDKYMRADREEGEEE